MTKENSREWTRPPALAAWLWAWLLVVAFIPLAHAGGIPPSPQNPAQPISSVTGGIGNYITAPPSPEIRALERKDHRLMYQDTLTTVVSHLNSEALRMAGRYNQVAITQVRDMMIIMVALLGLKIGFDLTGGLSGTMRAIGELFMIWGLVMWMLTDYAQITGWILHGFTSAANIVTGTLVKSGGFAPDYQMVNQAIQLLLDIRHLPWAQGATFMNLHLEGIFDSFVAMIFDLLMMIVLLFTGIITIIFYFLSQAYISVAIAVGPVFLPWAIIPWTRKYAANWVHFLIQGGMYRLIAPVMMALATQVTTITNDAQSNVVAVSPHGTVSLNFDAGVYMILFAILMAYFMLRIPSVVQSLSSGFLGSGLTGGMEGAVTRRAGNLSGSK